MPDWYAAVRTPILLLQSVLGVILFAYSLRRRGHFYLRLALSTALGCAVLHGAKLLFFPDMSNMVNSTGRIVLALAAYFILIAVCWCIFEESFWTALFTASSGYIAQDIAGTMKTLLRLIPFVNSLCLDDLGILLVDLVTYGGFYGLLYLSFRPFTRNREENFGNREKAVFSFVVLLFCVGMARIAQGNSTRNDTAVFAESIYQMLCGAFILLLQFGVMERAKLSRSVDAMRELVHQQYEQFRQSRESTALVNEKYHDLKGLLESFQGQISQEQIDRLKEKVGEYDTFAATGNRVLDVVIGEKRAVARRRGIELTTYVDGKPLGFVEELDLYSLIGNALNNAIDAASVLPEEERYIILTTSAEEGMVTVHVENPYSGELVMENHLPKSQRDERYHGFGMKSMERIVNKYSGTMAVKAENGIFYLDVILFAP